MMHIASEMRFIRDKKMETTQLLISTRIGRNFLGGPVVKNPPFNARNMGLISGRKNKILHALGQLSTKMKTQHSQNRKTNNLNCFKNRRMGKMYYINRRVQSQKGKMYCSYNNGFISQVQF